MKDMLMRHQQQALDRLKKYRGNQLLALPCGAGKTLTTLRYLVDEGLKRVLILAPKSVTGVWISEARKWFGMELVDMGVGRRNDKWIKMLNEGIWAVMSYESFLRDFTKNLALRNLELDALVADESSKIKSPTAQVSKAVRRATARRKILLNATVIENSLGDLWSQAECVKPGVLYGNFFLFRSRHAVMNEYFPGVKYWRDKEKVIEMCKDVVFSVPKEEVTKDLPPLAEQVVPVTLSPEQEYVYKRIRDEFIVEMEGEEMTVTNALTKLMRLRQATNGLWAFGDSDSPSAKLDALEELLSQFGTEKTLIFTQFSETADAICKGLRLNHKITGEVTKRNKVIEDWRKNGTALVGTSAMSRGNNLQDARFVVFMDCPWTYAAYEQSVGRAWRKGQQKPVTVYILEAAGTVDEKIRKLVWSKKEDGDLLTSLTLADIRGLV